MTQPVSSDFPIGAPLRGRMAAARTASPHRRSWRTALVCGVLVALWAAAGAGWAAEQKPRVKFRLVPTQFIAALGDPDATAGTGAEAWGIWTIDPGPRGVWLGDYPDLEAAGGLAPAKWQFDRSDWWVEENGMIMEKPEFPLPPGRYLVTGAREVTTMLTVHPADAEGNRRWELDNGARLSEVTHLPCRSARYTPVEGGSDCTPARAVKSEFPVSPGSVMPAVDGCHKQDYAVLFIIGLEVKT